MGVEDHRVTVIFQPSGRRVEVESGSTVFEAAKTGSVRIHNVCGGKGTCGKCRVILTRGAVHFEPEPHRKFFTAKDLEQGYRLACQCWAEGDVEVIIPSESRLEGEQILTKALVSSVELNPPATKLFFKLRGDGLQEELERALLARRGLGRPFLTEQAKKTLSSLSAAEKGGVEVTVALKRGGLGEEVFQVEEGDTTARSFGLAVDIGTTTVVVSLVDLKTGAIRDTVSDYNGQIAFGEDLLSRIDYAVVNSNGVGDLRRAVVETLNGLIEKVLVREEVQRGEILDVALAGNTVMTYLFLGLNPSPLIKTNAQVSREPVLRRAGDLGLSLNRDLEVYSLPSVSRYVGGDAIGDVLASNIFKQPELSVLIDMGTNGEIVLGSKGWIFSSSCASGPAFEGWEIKFGMRGAAGAIDHVQIEPETFTARFTVIGGSALKPRGICGSGLIDLIAEMFKTGILDAFGKIQKDQGGRRVRGGLEGVEYVVVPADLSGLEKDIVITQRDVDNLLQSKAAVCAAIAVLMKKVDASINDVQNLYLAGAFGNYMTPKSAEAIGVYPEFPYAKIHQIGNGALAGSYLTLLSEGKRRDAAAIARVMSYFDLSADPDFMEEYSAALFLPGRPDLFPSFARRRL